MVLFMDILKPVLEYVLLTLMQSKANHTINNSPNHHHFPMKRILFEQGINDPSSLQPQDASDQRTSNASNLDFF